MQDEVPPDVTDVGLHAIVETATAGVTVIVAVAFTPPPDAVITADVCTETEPAVAVNVTVVAP